MKQMRRTRALVFAALAAACGRDGPQGEAGGVPQPVARDSAGVRIVENGQVPPVGWRAGDSPLFTLGWGSDEPPFTWLQSGRIMPDGGALVGDFGSGTIYRVGPDGSVLATWGRKGEGPGEYQAFDAILLLGDSILVSDGRLRRVTVLSSDGEVLTTRPLAGAFLHQVSSILPDGRLLLVPGDGYGGVAEMPRSEWVFQTQPILAVHLEEGAADTLAELPHLRRWYGTRGASPGPVGVKGRAGGFAAGFAWARADEPEVRWYDGSGRLDQVARWDEEPVPLTSEWRSRMLRTHEEAYRARGAEDASVAAQLADLEEWLDRHEGPLPYWDSFHVDRRGNAWLSEYPQPRQPPGRWRVITRDGTFAGWVDLPGVIAILDITDDRILAVRENELDVPALVMIELFAP
jgi:hypothetical protein